MPGDEFLSQCQCAQIYVGGMPAPDTREWKSYCPVHGVDSEWYNSDEQRQRRKTKSQELVDLQKRAREARDDVRNRPNDSE